ncbi:MAG: nuclear transport factor 2 family protein [Burkholderiaceae bacterium]
MPAQQTLDAFIALVEANEHIRALEEFHLPDSTMQENLSAPRRGREAHVANEAKVMARAKSLTSTCVRPALVNGDHVVIRWIFEFTWLDGSVTRMEELAWQRWEGEKIAEETFFYDPAQRVPRMPQA